MHQYCLPDLPPVPLTTRVSTRAKRLRLRFSEHSGLELILPSGTTERAAQQMLARCEMWIRRQIERSLNMAAAHTADRSAVTDQSGQYQTGQQPGWQALLNGGHPLGESLFLPYSGESFTLQRGTGKNFSDCIVLPEDEDAARKKIRRWLCNHARHCLEAPLQTLAAEYGHTVRLVRVGLTHGRWGSCSIRSDRQVRGIFGKALPVGHISLSVRLLFMPPPLVRHVLLHELCHMVHMSHDARFYALLQQRDPQWQEHCRALRACAAAMPLWLNDVRAADI